MGEARDGAKGSSAMQILQWRPQRMLSERRERGPLLIHGAFCPALGPRPRAAADVASAFTDGSSPAAARSLLWFATAGFGWRRLAAALLPAPCLGHSALVVAAPHSDPSRRPLT